MTWRAVLGASLLLGLSNAVGCATARSEPPVAETISVPKAESGHDSAPAGRHADPTPSLTTKESKAIARVMAKVSELRGLPTTKPVPGVILGREALVARLRDKALREYPPEELKSEGQVLELLGFAPPAFDYLGALMHLLDAQLDGFYEPNDGTMYLAAELKGVDAQAALAHELMHAVQDQNFDLKARSQFHPGKGDETMALACLAEGEATSVMMDFLYEPRLKTALDFPDSVIRHQMESSLAGGEAGVPHILQSTLVSPYIDGLTFVHALRRKGGFANVDRAWKRVPTTTEQVLHVEKWEKNEPAIAIAPPTGAALGAGFTAIYEDSFGELGFALALEEWVGPAESRVLASGWGGDRSVLFAKADEQAMALHLRYDDATAGSPAALRPDAYAERAFAKIGAALKKKLGRRPVVDTPDALCFERQDIGPLILGRRGRSLFLGAGPTMLSGGRRVSTANCSLARPWSAEVLAGP